MTREEKRIWQAAYGAAFAALAAQTDRSPSCLRAVQAIETADSAVASLRDRQSSGDPRAGKRLW